MKNVKLLSLLLLVVLQGCATPYFQLYKTDSRDLKNDGNNLVYENKDVKIVFNYWNNGGNSGFYLYNKSDSNIYVDLKHSHLIVNDLAKTYFLNRSFSESSSASLSVNNYYSTSSFNSNSTAYGSALYSGNSVYASAQGSTVSSTSSTSTNNKTTVVKGNTVSYIEQDIICIPPKSAKVFDGFKLNGELYRDCDLYLYPTNKFIKSKSFEKENTPWNFRNIISYGYNVDNLNNIECEFWVSEISNYPYKNFIESQYNEYCGKKSSVLSKSYLYKTPNGFYITYSKGSTGVMH